MKKIIYIAVLSVLLMYLPGVYAYCIVRQGRIHQEMRELMGSLPSEEFETFIFTEEECRQVKINDREVRISGKMYAHSTSKLKEGKVILLARHNEAEDNIINFFNEVVKTGSHDQKLIPSLLLFFYMLVFLAKKNEIKIGYPLKRKYIPAVN